MKAVVLLSGGLDSTVALAMAVEAGYEIDTLTVNYGQRHAREVASAKRVAEYYGVPNVEVLLSRVLFGGSALTGDGDIPVGHATSPDATYVPARNTVLLALAAARAEAIGAGTVIIGANGGDAAGYPDCRREFIESFRDVLNLGTVNHVWVMAPLLDMSKAEILAHGHRLKAPVGRTWSCYQGGDYECGKCGACEELRSARQELDREKVHR